MKKIMLKLMLVVAIWLSCISTSAMTTMAAQTGWVMNENGAWTYVNKNGTLAKGYCRYSEGDGLFYFFWKPGMVDQDGNAHETSTLAWDKIIVKESTGEPMYVASKEGPLLQNHEIIYNGYIYRSNSKGELKKIKKVNTENDNVKRGVSGAATGAVALSSSWEKDDNSEDNSENTWQSDYRDISEIYQHQQESSDCTVCSVLMLVRSKALHDGNDWRNLTLKGLKSKYWSSSGMAWEGEYQYSFTSDAASIKNNIVGDRVGEVRFSNLASSLVKHPEGVVLYLYDAANYNKAHAVFVTRILNGTVFCLDPYGPSNEIPLASSPTFNSNFGLHDQQSILSLNNTIDGRSFLWYCN